MSKNPLAAKVAVPYARALYDFSIQKNLMHQITADFQNLEMFLSQTPDLVKYLNNPLIGKEQKAELLDKTLKTQLNNETFKFLSVLVRRDRINLLETVIENYLTLVYDLASIKIIEVSTAFAFTNMQKDTLTKKLKPYQPKQGLVWFTMQGFKFLLKTPLKFLFTENIEQDKIEIMREILKDYKR